MTTPHLPSIDLAPLSAPALAPHGLAVRDAFGAPLADAMFGLGRPAAPGVLVSIGSDNGIGPADAFSLVVSDADGAYRAELVAWETQVGAVGMGPSAPEAIAAAFAAWFA